MKELTIEQKANAYDKVVKEVKEFFEGRQKMPNDVTKTLEYLFPEFKESSEDERIRKTIIRFFKDNYPNATKMYDGIVTVGKVITWLEKQGEHANFRNKIQIGDKVTRNEAGELVNISQLERIAKPVKKENNIAEETNAPTEYGKYVDGCLNEAAKHFFSEGKDKYSVADLFYAGVRCGQSWLEKQVEKQ